MINLIKVCLELKQHPSMNLHVLTSSSHYLNCDFCIVKRRLQSVGLVPAFSRLVLSSVEFRTEFTKGPLKRRLLHLKFLPQLHLSPLPGQQVLCGELLRSPHGLQLAFIEPLSLSQLGLVFFPQPDFVLRQLLHSLHERFQLRMVQLGQLLLFKAGGCTLVMLTFQ